MAAPILPQEVTEHLEAAIQLSNRRVYLRFLDEAEKLIALNLPTTAILIAGIVLEPIVSAGQEQGTPDEWQQIERWLELRNNVAHPHVASPAASQAKEMVEGVRSYLTREVNFGTRLVPAKPSAEAPEQLRGKYRFVPTSSDEFIRRKADELRFEHDERRL